MSKKTVSNDAFMLKYCVDRYKTQEMRDKAVEDFIPALNLLLIVCYKYNGEKTSQCFIRR